MQAKIMKGRSPLPCTVAREQGFNKPSKLQQWTPERGEEMVLSRGSWLWFQTPERRCEGVQQRGYSWRLRQQRWLELQRFKREGTIVTRQASDKRLAGDEGVKLPEARVAVTKSALFLEQGKPRDGGPRDSVSKSKQGNNRRKMVSAKGHVVTVENTDQCLRSRTWNAAAECTRKKNGGCVKAVNLTWIGGIVNKTRNDIRRRDGEAGSKIVVFGDRDRTNQRWPPARLYRTEEREKGVPRNKKRFKKGIDEVLGVGKHTQ